MTTDLAVLEEETRQRLVTRYNTAWSYLADEFADAVQEEAQASTRRAFEHLYLGECNLRGLVLAQASSQFKTIRSIEKKERKLMLSAMTASSEEAIAQAADDIAEGSTSRRKSETIEQSVTYLELAETNIRGVYLMHEHGDRRAILSIAKKERKFLASTEPLTAAQAEKSRTSDSELIDATTHVPPSSAPDHSRSLEGQLLTETTSYESNLRHILAQQERSEHQNICVMYKKNDPRHHRASIPENGQQEAVGESREAIAPRRALSVVVLDLTEKEKEQYKSLVELSALAGSGSFRAIAGQAQAESDSATPPTTATSTEPTAPAGVGNASVSPILLLQSPPASSQTLPYSPTPAGDIPQLQPTPYGARSPQPPLYSPSPTGGTAPAVVVHTAPRPHVNDDETARGRPASEDPSVVLRPENNPHIRGTSHLAMIDDDDDERPSAFPQVEEGRDGASTAGDGEGETAPHDNQVPSASPEAAVVLAESPTPPIVPAKEGAQVVRDPFILYLLDELVHDEKMSRSGVDGEESEDRGNLLVDWELQIDELRNDERWNASRKQQQQRSADVAKPSGEKPSSPAVDSQAQYHKLYEQAAASGVSVMRRPSEDHNQARAHFHHPHAADTMHGHTLNQLLAAEMYEREEVAKHYRAVLRLLTDGLAAGKFENPPDPVPQSSKKPIGLPKAASPTVRSTAPPQQAISPPPLTIASTQRLVMGYSSGRQSLSPLGGASSALGDANHHRGRSTVSGQGGGRLDDIAAGVFIPEAHQLSAQNAGGSGGVAIPSGVPAAISGAASSSGSSKQQVQLSAAERQLILRKQIAHCTNDEAIEREMLVHDEVEELVRIEDAFREPIIEVFDWFISGYKQTLRHNRAPAGVGSLGSLYSGGVGGFAPLKPKDRHLPEYMRRSVSRLYSPQPTSTSPSPPQHAMPLPPSSAMQQLGYTFSPSPAAVLREVPRDLAKSVAGGLVNKFNDFGRAAPSMPKTLSPQPPAGSNMRKRLLPGQQQ